MSVESNQKSCLVIGASHAGVNCAFALRRNGWEGEIILIDRDPELPYHRPPLSKTYLKENEPIAAYALKPFESYRSEAISLELGVNVQRIEKEQNRIQLDDGRTVKYDRLVIATGARPLLPAIAGLPALKNRHVMRTAADALGIKKALSSMEKARVVLIGGGYIGLESAASIRQIGADVTVLEKEERILKRVTSPAVSNFYMELHQKHGVEIKLQKNVVKVEERNDTRLLFCSDGSTYEADIVLLGIGVKVNVELAQEAGLDVSNGIIVDDQCRTNVENIYAIGDCTYHYSTHKKRYLRLESVQNAVDQAKVAAAVICGQDVKYSAIPWFWSDQYHVKMQMVGLSHGYTDFVVRREEKDKDKFSVWYFNESELIAVDAINHPKAYVLGTKLLRSGGIIDKFRLAETSVDLKPTEILVDDSKNKDQNA